MTVAQRVVELALGVTPEPIDDRSFVYPAAGLADIAKQNGASVAEINPNPTMNAANFDHCIAGNSGVILPELVNSLRL